MTKSLIVPSLFIAASTLAAGDSLELKPWVYLQTRTDFARGSDASGKTDYTPSTEGTSHHDLADFYLRRARLGMKISGGSWSGSISFASDNVQRDGTLSARAAQLFDAWAGYTFKVDDMSHHIKAGLYRVRFNPVEGMGSSSHMFAANAATEIMQELRDIAVGYYLTTPMVNFNVDIGNPKNDGIAGQGTAGTPSPATESQKGDGLWTSFRLQFNGIDDGTFKPTTQWLESYAGAKGMNYAIGLEAMRSTEQDVVANAIPTATSKATITQFGADALLHMDELTALIEYRVQKTAVERSVGGNPADAVKMVWRVQAGYAFDLEDGTFLEPCVRFQAINVESLKGNFGVGRDWAQVSGNEYDIGLNWYLKGHANKLSAMITKWSAKEGDADATIFRLQHQISF